MSMRRLIVTVLVLACAACSPKAEAPQTAAAPAASPAPAAPAATPAPEPIQTATIDDPVELVKKIYGPYLAAGQHPAPLPDLAPWTEDLAALIKKMDEVSQGDAVIDVDPVIVAQDWKLSDLDVSLEGPAAEKAVAVAKFKNLGAATTVKFDLVRTFKGWRVDNIRSTDADLRKDIARGIADAGKPSDH